MSMIKTFLAGGGGGASLVIVGQPLDTIKVRMQADTLKQYKGVIDCATKAIRNEGPLALYKGIGPPLAATTPMYALCFFGYNQGKRVFCDDDAFDPENLKLVQIGLAGACSALFTTPIQAPQELLKCTLQTQTKGQFKGAIDVAKHLYATGGFRALTRGFSITLLRDASASVMYFSWYELMKAKLSAVPGLSSDGKVNFGGVLVAGGVAGIWNWAPAIPFDVFKTKFQTSAPGTYSGAILGSKSVMKEVLANEGIKGCFRGTAPIFIRAVPANAACFCGYEVCFSALTNAGLE
jgi:solute carrier family 25 carnitine/acylcarnitine transporter 20/29